MREHRSFWLKSLGVICFSVAAVSTVPKLFAQQFQGEGAPAKSPLDKAAVADVRTQVALPGVTALAVQRLGRAREAAHAQMVAASDDEALGLAQQAFVQRRYDDAERITRALITHREKQLADTATPEAKRADIQKNLDQARFLLAHVFGRTDRPTKAAREFGRISKHTPVADFIDWLRGKALRAAGQPAAAAQAFHAAYEHDTTLVKLRARLLEAHALAEAHEWAKALPVLDEVLTNFPDYPRRYELLWQRAQGLEAQGELDEAAQAYQQTWYEFPHKAEGQKARQMVERLAKRGHPAPPISRDDLFERYRRLRINKHWALAERLFKELLAANKTPGGHSDFEHEILMQLALNDYVPQHYRQAMGWLQKLRREYEAGNTDGISDDLLYTYLSRTYGRLGDVDKALTELQTRDADRGSYAQRRDKAEFFEEYGMYARAKKVYDTYYSKWRKLGWHYTWLLYKTGHFQQAYENLTRLAERSHGERRAKYMYWAARTLERGGNADEALKLFHDVAQAYDLSYYGIQANNRILDIRQRRAVDGRLLAQTKGLVDNGAHVLQVMDDTADALSKQGKARAAVYRDPRTVPRTGDDEHTAPPQEAAELSSVKCDADSSEDRAFCQLMNGELPDESREALQMAVAPVQPYLGMLSTGLPTLNSKQAAEASMDDDDADDVVELGDNAGTDAPAPRRGVRVAKLNAKVPRVSYDTEARIYWEGRRDSPIAFVKAQQGKVIGPLPDHPWAYDQKSYHHGLARAVAKAGDLFPQLERAQWLRDAGYLKYARWAMRDADLEFRGLSELGRPSGEPHELPNQRWAYLIDNRRHETGLWGYQSDELRYPVPDDAAAQKKLLERQQAIYDRRDELEPLMLAAMKDVGDYHLVRRFTLGTGPWYHKDPEGPMRYKWMQAYPRAFPRQVLRESIKNGLNPYLVWALMTVESSYNPDSISPADALGLLQVIPRTGIKTAEMLGDDEFGPMDLLDEDVAIKQGAFYFSKLVKKFHGQELLAIAGYNGGPHRVGAWLDKRGKGMPLDEFVEEIPFNEARGYTKKVIRYLALYLRIYEGIDHLYIGQKMRVDYLPNPNF